VLFKDVFLWWLFELTHHFTVVKSVVVICGSNMEIQRSLLLTSCTWDNGNYESFRMIPVTQDCPYVEAFYDPVEKVLVVLSKEKKESVTLLPKLDEYGNAAQKHNRPLVDRQRVTYFKEYYIKKPEEIREFIELFAINADGFDYNQLMKTAAEAA